MRDRVEIEAVQGMLLVNSTDLLLATIRRHIDQCADQSDARRAEPMLRDLFAELDRRLSAGHPVPAQWGESGPLTSEEQVRFTPTIRTETSDGEVTRLEVGLTVELADGRKHTVTLVPSVMTNEGDGTGNVFVYEDDDPVAHLAWGPADAVPAPRRPGSPERN